MTVNDLTVSMGHYRIPLYLTECFRNAIPTSKFSIPKIMCQQKYPTSTKNYPTNVIINPQTTSPKLVVN
jgi:hypothetical protein